MITEFYPTPELAKAAIKRLVPNRTVFGKETGVLRKIVGYRKYGNKDFGYSFVPTLRYVNSDGSLGNTIHELRTEEFETYFELVPYNKPNTVKINNILKY